LYVGSFITCKIKLFQALDFVNKFIEFEMVALVSFVNVKALGYFSGYDTTIKPMIRNAFATAAFRFGHSFLRDRFKWGFSFPFLHTQFNWEAMVPSTLDIKGSQITSKICHCFE
jgi:hypothetical protein